MNMQALAFVFKLVSVIYVTAAEHLFDLDGSI